MFITGSTITIDSSYISDNQVYGDDDHGDNDSRAYIRGGGIYLESGVLTLTNSELSNNITDGEGEERTYEGAGLYVAGGTANIS